MTTLPSWVTDLPVQPGGTRAQGATGFRSGGRPAAWRDRRIWAVGLIVWTIVGLVMTQQSYYVALSMGAPGSVWRRLLVGSFGGCALWALMTPFIVTAARRFPIEDLRSGRAIGIHLAIGTLCAFLDAALNWNIGPGPGGQPMSLGLLMIRLYLWNLTCYLVIVALTLAIDFARLYRERIVAEADLRAQLSSAQLRALQSQLRPHFLFNTLNTIAEEVHTDPAAADRMITNLASLLRSSLQHSGVSRIPLGEEMETLAHYLDIVQARLRDRLTVEVDIPRAAAAASVPAMLLQPLVENAVQHGAEPNPGPTIIRIQGRVAGKQLELSVSDDGAGLPPGGHRERIGLRNTRERLRQLYGDAFEMTVRPRAGGGVESAITIPAVPLEREVSVDAR
jgi:two-component sensor histidine kinase